MSASIESALWWTFLNILSIVALAFFSMQEMACISFNRIRLHYYVSKGMRRAIWLNYLLQNPSKLFGVTLLSVNCAMFIGSEFARETYIALGLSPDLAPITQVAIVIIFAELAPMFAARRYAEHVALAGAPILYATTKILSPILWSIGWITNLADKVTGKKSSEEHIVLNQEDLQRILDEQEEDRPMEGEGEDLNTVARNIFSLRGKDASHIMQPIDTVPSLPSNATVEQVQQLLIKKPELTYIPVYQRDIKHIVGIIYPRDLIRVPGTKRLRDHATSPWFITQYTKAIQILKEFRRSNRNVAIVLNEQGLAIGMITLDDLEEEIFGKMPLAFEKQKSQKAKSLLIIDRTFPGDMKVKDFNAQFDVVLDEDGDLTLAELMTKLLDHQPEVDESVYIPPFELTVTETSLTEVKKVAVTTHID